MSEEHIHGVRSTASVAGHPIHPMLIPFPFAFLIATLGTDIAYWSTGNSFWALASLWLVGAGLVMGVLAAIVGLTDFLTISRARDHLDGWVHFLGNLGVLVLALVSLLTRVSDPLAGAVPIGIILSVLIVGILAMTGWFGGELAYRHMIGVVGDVEQGS